MKIFLLLFLVFISRIGICQTDEHVMLNLGLDSVFSLIKDNEPGGSIYIQQDNQIIYSRSFGLANLKTKEKFTENTNSNLASITKTFIAYSILILQKQGKLSIEDSIKMYFPELKDKATDAIRIRHLLTHSSGLPDIITTGEDLLGNIPRPEFEPGSNFKYSEIAYKILISIIEKVGKDKWDIFIKKNILEPAGMINTKIDINYPAEKGTASYKKNKNKQYNSKKKNGKNPESAVVWSSVGELKKYVYAIKECVFLDCEILKRSTQIQLSPNWRGSNPPPHSLAWYTKETVNKDSSIEYNGSENGFRSTIIMYPKQNIIVILVSNNNTSYYEALHKRLVNLKYIK